MENKRKRKREVDEADDGSDGQGEISSTKRQALHNSDKQPKRQKLHKEDDNTQKKTKEITEITPDQDEAIRQQKAEKRRQKRERRKEKKQSKQERKEAKKKQTDKASNSATPATSRFFTDAKADEFDSEDDVDGAADQESIAAQDDTNEPNQFVDVEAEDGSSEGDGIDEENGDTGIDLELDGFNDGDSVASKDDSVSSDISSDPDTPTFDRSASGSSASSSSSIVPPSETSSNHVHTKEIKTQIAELPLPKLKSSSNVTKSGSAVKQQPLPQILTSHKDAEASQENSEQSPKLTEIDSEKLKQRLESRLAALRAARKADGPDGKPARNRDDLINARRQKQERRKQHKKELRQKAKQEQSAEAEAARLRGGSGSPMWSPNAILSPREPQNNFSFGKVAFADGQAFDMSSGGVDGKKKGPQDVKTALEAAQKKQNRLSGLDQGKRADIEEKDRWLNAKKRVQGEKLRDNTSLLKKTLKRKDKGKAKSEKEWTDRIQGVQAGKEAKQRKREDNLKKRKDEKGSKKSKGKPAPKPKKRPGFEGSWKLGSKGSGKA